jgi:hypothetical protein
VEWLTDEARTFLVGAEYDLRTRPEQLDFSSTVLAYAKAVEQMLGKRACSPVSAAEGRATAADCRSDYLFQKIHERRQAADAGSVIGDISAQHQGSWPCAQFGERASIWTPPGRSLGRRVSSGLLADKAAVELRNRAAHDTVLTREDALHMRGRGRWGSWRLL